MQPSTLELLRTLFAFLQANAELKVLADVVSSDSLTPSKLPQHKGRVVVRELREAIAGKVLTEAFNHPWVQFACYHQTEAQSRHLCEQLQGILRGIDLQMNGQTLENSFRRQIIAPVRDDELNLWVCAVVYVFAIAVDEDW